MPMAFLRAKPIGVMQMIDQGEQDDKARRCRPFCRHWAVCAGSVTACAAPVLCMTPCCVRRSLRCTRTTPSSRASMTSRSCPSTAWRRSVGTQRAAHACCLWSWPCAPACMRAGMHACCRDAASAGSVPARMPMSLHMPRFFEDYKKNEHKEVKVDEILGREEAWKAIKESMVCFCQAAVMPALCS